MAGAIVVWFGRAGYRDSTGRPVGWLTAFYYATVTLTTIGYGDVVPVTPAARLINILVITPLRLGFLLILVGTTLRAVGDGTRIAVLDRAEVRKASQVMVTTGRDDTAVLAVLTVRRMHKNVAITASVKQTENAPLLRDGGADVVITSSEVAGQLWTSALNPTVGLVMEDMLAGGLDLRVSERGPDAGEVGLVPQQVREAVMAVVRDGTPVLYDHPGLGAIRPDDRLVVLRSMPQAEEGRRKRMRMRLVRERFTGEPDDSRQ